MYPIIRKIDNIPPIKKKSVNILYWKLTILRNKKFNKNPIGIPKKKDTLWLLNNKKVIKYKMPGVTNQIKKTKTTSSLFGEDGMSSCLSQVSFIFLNKFMSFIVESSYLQLEKAETR